MDHSVEKMLGEQLIKVVTVAEEEIDRQIEKYDNLDENDLEAIRKKRLEELKKKQLQRQKWLQNGHGVYEEIPDERTFFDATKKSAKVVCHFYLPTTERCKIVDKHLRIIAPKHLETRFISANAEKFRKVCLRISGYFPGPWHIYSITRIKLMNEPSSRRFQFPFLTKRLKIRVIPTIVVIIDSKTIDYIRGFDDLGGKDEFRTETLEWRLSRSEVLEYDGPSYLRGYGMTVKKLTKGIKKKEENEVDDDW